MQEHLIKQLILHCFIDLKSIPDKNTLQNTLPTAACPRYPYAIVQFNQGLFWLRDGYRGQAAVRKGLFNQCYAGLLI